MRTSLRLLRELGLTKHGYDVRDRKGPRFEDPVAQLDELSKATQDMLDMRDCYDSLLSAAAATANSAYEFSESIREMGACLLEKTALNDDEDSGRVLIMLGKVQFELQKLVDSYRSHIFRTITIPSESLLNELRTVEDMKNQCDEKREVFEHMLKRHREKGRLRSNKGQTISPQQLKVAHDEYDEEATLFLFRLKSLKEGQSRSLLTQAARHHAAQLSFFRRAVTSLETVEPHVKLVTELQHIDYLFSGLEDDGGDDNDDDDDSGSSDDYDDGELSFDYGPNDLPHDISARNSIELDHVDITFPQVSTVDTTKENMDKIPNGDSLAFGREQRTSSQSAPLFAEVKVDPAERFRHMRQLSTRKFTTYKLPTPDETKSQVLTGLESKVPQARLASISGGVNLWHSSPLEQKKYEKILEEEKLPRPTVVNIHSVLKESNNNSTSSRLPPPLTEGLSLPQLDPRASDSKKTKRQAFSGPISNQSWSNKSVLSSRETFVSKAHPLLFSGPILRSPLLQSSSSPKVSPTASPPFVSSPKISELHELPRPPANSTSILAARPSYLVTHSSPLMSKGQEHSATNKFVVSNTASPLPTPPQTVPRSFSIPSRGQKATALPASEAFEASARLKMVEDIASPPLTPISLSIAKPASTASETVIPLSQSRGKQQTHQTEPGGNSSFAKVSEAKLSSLTKTSRVDWPKFRPSTGSY